MLFELEKEQQLAFNRLKKAYKDCEKLKVLLVNQYGTIHAYNEKIVEDFGDDQMRPKGHNVKYDVATECFYNTNTINNVDPGGADDEGLWYLGLTDKGLEIYKNETSHL